MNMKNNVLRPMMLAFLLLHSGNVFGVSRLLEKACLLGVGFVAGREYQIFQRDGQQKYQARLQNGFGQLGSALSTVTQSFTIQLKKLTGKKAG